MANILFFIASSFIILFTVTTVLSLATVVRRSDNLADKIMEAEQDNIEGEKP